MPYRWPADTDLRDGSSTSSIVTVQLADVECMSAITGIATFIRSKARWNWSASSTTVPTPAVRDTAKPRAPKSKQASLHLIGRSAGTFSAGSDIDGSLDIGRFPKSETNSSMLTGSNSPTRASAITSIATRPCWPRATGPCGLTPTVRQGRRVDSYDRRSTTREGTRDLVRREGADPETCVVRRAFALRDSGRGTAPDQKGQRVGRVIEQACGTLVVGQARCFRDRDRGGVS